jgi:hypothetical protein
MTTKRKAAPKKKAAGARTKARKRKTAKGRIRPTLSTLAHPAKTDVSAMLESDNEWSRSAALAMKRKAAAQSAIMSPPDALGLPKWLDQRRLDYGITDGAFDFTPIGNHVYLHQIEATENLGDSVSLVSTDVGRDHETKAMPRGVLVSAGLSAMDVLAGNGWQLGDIVSFLELAPWRDVVDRKGGFAFELIGMKVHDLRGNLDLTDRLYFGELSTEWNDEYKMFQLVDKKGNAIQRTAKPYLRGDY